MQSLIIKAADHLSVDSIVLIFSCLLVIISIKLFIVFIILWFLILFFGIHLKLRGDYPNGRPPKRRRTIPQNKNVVHVDFKSQSKRAA